MQKNKTGLLSYTTHKNQLKMDENFEYKSWKHKTPRRKHKGKSPRCCGLWQFFGFDTKAKATKAKIKQ